MPLEDLNNTATNVWGNDAGRKLHRVRLQLRLIINDMLPR
jgi:hypothetical protein